MSKRALIIGGAIGGLSAALALRQMGYEVQVYERTPELREVGAGLSLWANATKALKKLGIDLLSIGHAEGDGGIRSWHGDWLVKTSSAELARRYGASTIAVYRNDLLNTLAERVGKGSIQLGHELVDLKQDGSGVVATFANGSTAQGDLLIGADGIRSVVRAKLFGTQPPRYSGYVAWRGVTDLQNDLIGFETWGYGKRFGYVPMSNGRVYWFATKNTPAGQQDDPGGRKAELQQLFRGWHDPIEQLIAATDEKAILRNDIYDRPPITQWSVGRVTLLGDAAHATTPNLGQGACQAIEDAVVLANCLRDAEIEPALRRYESLRIPRTSMIVNRSWMIGCMGQLENPLLCELRNTLLRLMPSSVNMRQFDAVAGYEV